MRIWFQTDRTSARRGDEVTVGAFVENSFATTLDVAYGIESDPPLGWGVLGPSQLPPGSTTPLTVRLDVPEDLPAEHTSVPVTIAVGVGGTQLRAQAETVIDLKGARRPCAAFATPPTVRLNADGSATATIGLVNCGPFDLTVDLRVRHAGGWQFDIDTPQLTLTAGSGPVTVTATLDRPGDLSIEVGDRLRIEVEADGEVLTSADVSLHATAPARRTTMRRLLSSGVMTVLLLFAVATIGRAIGGGTPQQEPPVPASTGDPELPADDGGSGPVVTPPDGGVEPDRGGGGGGGTGGGGTGGGGGGDDPDDPVRHTIESFNADFDGERCATDLSWDTNGAGRVNVTRTIAGTPAEILVASVEQRTVDDLGDVLAGTDTPVVVYYELAALDANGDVTDRTTRPVETLCAPDELPDLVVIRGGDDGPEQAFVVVGNSGDAPSGPFTVLVVLSSSGDTIDQDPFTVDPLAPGAEKTLTWPCMAADVAVTIDPGDTADADLGNNEMTFAVDCGPRVDTDPNRRPEIDPDVEFEMETPTESDDPPVD